MFFWKESFHLAVKLCHELGKLMRYATDVQVKIDHLFELEVFELEDVYDHSQDNKNDGTNITPQPPWLLDFQIFLSHLFTLNCPFILINFYSPNGLSISSIRFLPQYPSSVTLFPPSPTMSQIQQLGKSRRSFGRLFLVSRHSLGYYKSTCHWICTTFTSLILTLWSRIDP